MDAPEPGTAVLTQAQSPQATLSQSLPWRAQPRGGMWSTAERSDLAGEASPREPCPLGSRGPPGHFQDPTWVRLRAAGGADDPKPTARSPGHFQNGGHPRLAPRCSGATDSRSENRMDKILLGFDSFSPPASLSAPETCVSRRSRELGPTQEPERGQEPPAEPGARPPDVLAQGGPVPQEQTEVRGWAARKYHPTAQ